MQFFPTALRFQHTLQTMSMTIPEDGDSDAKENRDFF
jgi:hypothetical protein